MYIKIKLFISYIDIWIHLVWYCRKYILRSIAYYMCQQWDTLKGFFRKKPKIISSKDLELLLSKHRQSILGINDGKITDIIFPYEEK